MIKIKKNQFHKKTLTKKNSPANSIILLSEMSQDDTIKKIRTNYKTQNSKFNVEWWK